MNVKFVLVFVTAITLFMTTPVVLNALSVQASLEASMDPLPRSGKVVMQDFVTNPKAPMVASGENLYVVWWTNKSGNWEVMFRASNDIGQTIGDKINLSNTTDADSQNAEIVTSGNNVFVSWWETSTNPANKTSESVLRISTNNGQTFGPLLVLSNNGTLTGGG
jgi:hypothetical protein